MTGDFSFGALKKEKKKTSTLRGNTTDTTFQRTVTPTRSTPTPDRPETNWEKKYKKVDGLYYDACKELEALRKSHADTFNELTELKAWADAVKKDQKEKYELTDEIHRLTVQNNMSKKVIDKLTKEAQKYQFRPQQYSEIAQLLVSMRVRGNRAQKETVMNIVGSTDIVEVRKYIFKLLEEPYVE